MPFSFRELFFGGHTFCCCIPVRVGVIIMSLLGMILSAILSIVLWYELASSQNLSSGERAFFAITALIETFLFIASILGFVGAIVRKQLFVRLYAYFIYVHFLLNIAIAGYLLYQVTHLTSEAADVVCQDTIQNQGAQDQCSRFLKVARGVYFAVASLVLLVELYGAIIVTRYMNQIKSEKRMAKAGLEGGEGYRMTPHAKYTRLSAAGVDLPHDNPYVARNPYTSSRTSYVPSLRSFNPYEELEVDDYHSPLNAVASTSKPYPYDDPSYGGGTWTHSEISAHEKARMGEDSESEDAATPPPKARSLHNDLLKDSEAPLQSVKSVDSLPRYTLSDPGPASRDP